MQKKSEITIRLAESGDFHAVQQLEHLSFDASDRFSDRVIKYHIRKHKLYVLVDDGGVAAYCVLVFYRKSIRLYSLAVLPKKRRKGYASALIAFVVSMAAEMQKEYVTLEVADNNAGARALYEKYGFIKTRSLPGYYDTADGIRLEKRIG